MEFIITFKEEATMLGTTMPKFYEPKSTLQWQKNVVVQVLFFKIVQLQTSTRPILKESFINYIQNKGF